MKEELLSIIIPVYNVEKYLLHCWEGLKNQTYINCEFIFVNDCSTDGSERILEDISLEDERVYLLKTECNSGVSKARNIGLDFARGKYIGFCDADDFCMPDMYENMIKGINDTEADISCCAVRRVDNEGRFLYDEFCADEQFVCASEDALGYWLDSKYIGNSVYTKIFKAELWNNVRFPVGQIFEEAYVIPKLILKSKRIVHIGIAEYCYYRRPNSYTTKPFDEEKLIVYEREKYIYNMTVSRMPDLKVKYENFIVRSHVDLYYDAIQGKIDDLISDAAYELIKSEFYKIAVTGILNPYVSLKYKLKIIELFSGIAMIRKRIKR